MITLLIVLVALGAYGAGALATMRYLYGLWRARKLDQLMADSRAVLDAGGFDQRTGRYRCSEYRARTLAEAQAVYMKPSSNGARHGDHMAGALACAWVWPGVWWVIGVRAAGMLLMRGLTVYAAGSTRKPLAQLRAEREAAERAVREKAAAQAQRIAELERELGWDKQD
jgi:hypothetical protein